jgi:hypothetical protein
MESLRKFILTVLIGVLTLSCAAPAKYRTYDIYANHPFVYDEDGIWIKDHFPPVILEKGQSYVIYLGTSIRTKRRQGVTWIYVKEKAYPICGKIDVRNGTKVYIHISNPTGLKYRYHLIINGKRYMQHEM